MILSEGGDTMITEAPEPDCTFGAPPLLRADMAQARRTVRLCRHAVVTGVAFFEYLHGRDYAAPERDRAASDPALRLPPLDRQG